MHLNGFILVSLLIMCNIKIPEFDDFKVFAALAKISIIKP